MEDKVSELTSNLGFVGLDFYIYLVYIHLQIRYITLSQFEFELRADVPITRSIGERP